MRPSTRGLQPLAALLLLTASAAAAQDEQRVSISEAAKTFRVLPDECGPNRKTGEIVVCGHRNPSAEYRIPPPTRFDPNGPVASVSRERNRLLGPNAGSLGSCSMTGPNGMTGCLNQRVWRDREQKGE
jgi:hypothetical protein